MILLIFLLPNSENTLFSIRGHQFTRFFTPKLEKHTFTFYSQREKRHFLVFAIMNLLIFLLPNLKNTLLRIFLLPNFKKKLFSIRGHEFTNFLTPKFKKHTF